MNKNARKEEILKNSDSYIISLLSSLALFLRRSFFGSLFSLLFTTYQSTEKRFKKSFFAGWVKKSKLRNYFYKTSARISGVIEKNKTRNYIIKKVNRLIAVKARNYGVFFISAGLYSLLVYFLKKYAFTSMTENTFSLILSVVMIFVGFTLLPRQKTVAELFCSDSFLGFVAFELFGAKRYRMCEIEKEESSSALPFILGMIMGLLFFVFDTKQILIILCLPAFSYLVLRKPEIGAVFLFAVPMFLNTSLIVYISALTFASYIFKFIRAKRTFRFTFCDVFVVLLAISALFTVNGALQNIKIICGFLSYFAIKNTLRSLEWINRAVMLTVYSALGVCAVCIADSILSRSFFAADSIIVSPIFNYTDIGTFAVFLIMTLFYPLVLSSERKGKTGRKTLIFTFFIILFVLLTLHSKGACLALAIVISLYFLTYSERSFAYYTVLGIPATLLLSFVPQKFYLNSDIIEEFYGKTQNFYTRLSEGTSGICAILFVLCLAYFFKRALSYTVNTYGGVVKKSSMTKIIKAPYFGVLAVALYAILGSADLAAVLPMLFMQCALGDCMISYAEDNDVAEYEFFSKISEGDSV